jgi:hypothetical protein
VCVAAHQVCCILFSTECQVVMLCERTCWCCFCRFLDVLGPGPLFVGYPSSDALTKHLAESLKSSGNFVRNDVKVCLCFTIGWVGGSVWGRWVGGWVGGWVACPAIGSCISGELPFALFDRNENSTVIRWTPAPASMSHQHFLRGVLQFTISIVILASNPTGCLSVPPTPAPPPTSTPRLHCILQTAGSQGCV